MTRVVYFMDLDNTLYVSLSTYADGITPCEAAAKVPHEKCASVLKTAVLLRPGATELLKTLKATENTDVVVFTNSDSGFADPRIDALGLWEYFTHEGYYIDSDKDVRINHPIYKGEGNMYKCVVRATQKHATDFVDNPVTLWHGFLTYFDVAGLLVDDSHGHIAINDKLCVYGVSEYYARVYNMTSELQAVDEGERIEDIPQSEDIPHLNTNENGACGHCSAAIARQRHNTHMAVKSNPITRADVDNIVAMGNCLRNIGSAVLKTLEQLQPEPDVAEYAAKAFNESGYYDNVHAAIHDVVHQRTINGMRARLQQISGPVKRRTVKEWKLFCNALNPVGKSP